MIPIPVRSASDTKISVTVTATNLYSLIDTAGGKGAQNYYDGKFTNGIFITPEDGDIRYLTDNVSPTATEGQPISSGTTWYLPGIDLSQLRLIRQGSSDVACTITFAQSERVDTPAAVAYDVTLETGDIEIGAVEIKDGDSDTRLDVEQDTTKNAAFVQSETLATSAKQDTINTTLANRLSTTSFNSRDAATLAADATFQGTGELVTGYGRAGVSITSTTGTATGTVTMEVSHDGSTYSGPTRTWAAYDAPLMWNIVEPYFRLKYVNDSVEAANFAIKVQYSNNADIVLGHQVNEILPKNTEAQAMRPTNDFGLDTARVHIKGQSAEFFFGFKSVVTTTPDWTDIHPSTGDIQWQTTPLGVECISSDVNDNCGREVTKVVADSRTNTTDGQYFDITAQDGSLYRVYMDTTGADATIPAAGGRTLTRVDIFTGVADTATGSADALSLVLDALADFGSPSYGNGTTYTTDVNAGTVTDAANGDLGNAWAISTHAQGATEGVGVTSIEIHGLAADGADQEDVMLTHGTTVSPPTLNTYIRMNKAHSETCGTYGGSHEGNITIRRSGGGATMSYMTGEEGSAGASVQYGSGEAGNGYWTVPLGKVMYITHLEVIPDIAANKFLTIHLYEREDILQTTSPYSPRRILWGEDGVQEAIEKDFVSHIKIKSLADVWFRAVASGSASVQVSLDYYLVDADVNGA